ncbi:MAG: lytic transglycosylase domain-containing protein [Candidatus Aminicenantes bacterium]|nr:lytic transglycosylase domain-containing protein [Candidatus Aminicenantes bacterium]
MTLKKIQYSMFILFMLATGVLTLLTINLSEQKLESRAAIQVLTREVSLMDKKITDFEKYKSEIDLYQFQENIFKLKYPRFAEIAKIVFSKSEKYGFNPYLIMAMIQVESDFKPYAVSKAGAYGLMQVTYSVWKDELNIRFNRIFEKEYNIELGLKILKHYYDETDGDLLKALFHYNNGYKYNNTKYSVKVISTLFYTNKDKAPKAGKKKEENLTI